MRIISDVDGVWLDFVGRYLEVLRNDFGIHAKEQDVAEYQIEKALQLPEPMVVGMYRAMKKPGFCASIEPYPGAVEQVREIAQVHDLYFATSPFRSFDPEPPITWASEREQAMARHFDVTPYRVANLSCKHILRADLLVEDSVDNAVAWAAENPKGRVWIVRRPWNEWEERKLQTWKSQFTWGSTQDLTRLILSGVIG